MTPAENERKNMSETTKSECGSFTLIGDTYFKHVNAKFSHIGDGDTVVCKDCDGNFAELYLDPDGQEIATLLDFNAEDLDLLPSLEFCSLTKPAIRHLLDLGFNADSLPAL